MLQSVLIMVNFSHALLHGRFRQHHPDYSILDLKSHYRGCRYASETIKMASAKNPILFYWLTFFSKSPRLGAIHTASFNLP